MNNLGDYLKLIHSVVNRFAGTYGGDRDDLFSQALLIFVIARDTYIPARSSFVTYLYLMLEWRLHRYVTKQQRLRLSEVPLNDYLPYKERCFDSIEFALSLQTMGDDAKRVADSVIIDRLTKRELKKELKEDGWAIWRVRDAFKEVSNFVEAQ